MFESSCSWLYYKKSWHIDEEKELCIFDEKQNEERFIVHSMVRLARKEIGGEKADWWAFNNKRIILHEERFNWSATSLPAKLAQKRKVAKADKDEAKSIFQLKYRFPTRAVEESIERHHPTSKSVRTQGLLMMCLFSLWV